MFGLSRKTDYALLLLAALARLRPSLPSGRQGYGGQARRYGKFISVRSLAEEYHLPYRFASQILGDLARAQILDVREGVKGGYRFAKDPATVSVADVLQATERKRALVACLDRANHYACPQKAWCGAKSGVRLLERNLLAVLRKTTVAELLRAPSAALPALSPAHDTRS